MGEISISLFQSIDTWDQYRRNVKNLLVLAEGAHHWSVEYIATGDICSTILDNFGHAKAE